MVNKPPLRVAHKKMPPPDGGHLGRDIWQKLLRLPPLCLHLHDSADPSHPKETLGESAEERGVLTLQENDLILNTSDSL